MWINKVKLPIFGVCAGSKYWLQYRLIFSQNQLGFMASTLHSLCQERIRKYPGQHCIKDQHCAEHYHADSIRYWLKSSITVRCHYHRCFVGWLWLMTRIVQMQNISSRRFSFMHSVTNNVCLLYHHHSKLYLMKSSAKFTFFT